MIARQNRARGLALGALCGVLTAAVAVGIAQLAAAFTAPRAAPMIAVAGTVVDGVPQELKEFAVQTFGTWDKVVLLSGMGVVLAAFAALIGILARRALWLGMVGIALFGAIGIAAAVTRPESTVLAALPSLVGAVGGAVALVLLTRAAAAPTQSPAQPLASTEPSERVEPESGEVPPVQVGAGGSGFDRRRFILAATAVAGVSAGAGAAGSWLGGSSAEATAARAAIRLPDPASPAPKLAAGTKLDVPGLADFFTGNTDFYRIDTAFAVPELDARSWKLRLHGNGIEQVEYDYFDLLNRSDLVERDITLACVSNPVGGSYVGNARWIGVPLEALLREAGVRTPKDGGPADQLVSRSSDGMTIGTPVATVMDGRDAILALGMNGEPLPVEHGYPVRMVVPGLYGYVSACKWLVDLELTAFDSFDAYWVPRGWSAKGPIKTQSRIDTPREGDDVPAEQVMIAGVAWAQTRGISAVEVSIDDGDWQEARLAAEDSEDTWRQWVLEWDAEPGEHTLRVRATDGEGSTQTEARAEPAPNGASGWHTVRVTAA